MNTGASLSYLSALTRISALVLILLLAAAPASGQGEVDISFIMPNVLSPGQSATLVAEGEGFMPGCEISFAPSSVYTEDLRVLGPTLMEIDVVVSPSAAPGEVTVLYSFQGMTFSFDGLLEIKGMPQIGGISPTQLYGPQDYQQLEVSGQFFSEEWVDALGIEAMMASGNLGYDLGATKWYIDATSFAIELVTPQEYYANPCTIFIELSDPIRGLISSFEIPVEVEEPKSDPVVDSILLEPDGAVALGDYPTQVSGTLTVEGSGLGSIDPATLRVTGHKVTHLQLPPGSNPQLSSISVTDTEITADFAYSVADDDRSFVNEGSGSGVLLLADLTESFSYTLELSWPPPELDRLELQTTGSITGTISGQAISLSGDPVQLSATLTGDYLRELPGTELVLTSELCVFDYGFDLTYGTGATSAKADVTLAPISLEAEVPAVPFLAEFLAGGSSIQADFSVPVELTQIVPELSLESAVFMPDGPFAQPAAGQCQLELVFTGDNLELLDFDAESFQLETGGADLRLVIEGRDNISLSPALVTALYRVSIVAPDVMATPLAGNPQLEQTEVAYPVSVQFNEFSEDYDATFFATGEADITLAYPPEFDALELAGDPTDLGDGRFSAPVTILGTNLLPRYFASGSGFITCMDSSFGPIEFDGFEPTGGSSEALTGVADFSVAELIAADPTPREESFNLTLIEEQGGMELVSAPFTLQLGLAPVFRSLTVDYPGVDELVETEFDISFSVAGANLVPQYFESAAASLQIVDPPLPAQFEMGALELQSASSQLVECVIPAAAVQFDAAEPVVARLTLVPAVEGAAALSGEFVLDLVLPPLVQAFQATVDHPLVLPEETEFQLLFQISGEHFRPEYFEDLGFIIEPDTPLPGAARIVTASPVIQDLSATSAAGWVECALVDAESLTADQLRLRCTALASALEVSPAVALLQLEQAAGPELRFSVPGAARLVREGGVALLELPLSTRSAVAADLPFHGEVQLASGDSLGFDFELAAGEQLAESFELEATALFDSLLASRGPAGLAESAGSLSLELTSPELPEFSSLAQRIPCEVVAPLELASLEVVNVYPAELKLDDPAGLQLSIVAKGDNLDLTSFVAYTRFNPDGVPLRAEVSVQFQEYDVFEARINLSGADALELAEDLDPDAEEIEAELELRGTSLDGASANYTALYRLGLPPAAVPRGLSLVIDETQQLFPIYRTTGVEEGYVGVELELRMDFMSGQDRVHNIRGLRFDERSAEDAVLLQVGDDEFSPAELSRIREDLLSIEFEIPEDSFQPTGVTTGEFVVATEDLAYAYEPAPITDGEVVEVYIDLHWSGAPMEGGTDIEIDFNRPWVITSMTLIPGDPEEMFSADTAFVRFEWESRADSAPVYDDDGLLIGFDTAQDIGGGQVRIDPASYCDTLNRAERVRFQLSTQKGLRTLQPEPAQFLPDGTGFAAIDIGGLAEGEEFEIEVEAEEEQDLGFFDLWKLPLPDPLPIPEPDFAPRWTDMIPVGVYTIPGWKPKEMSEEECYAARDEYEQAKEDYEEADEECDCDDEYQAYLDALRHEERIAAQRRNAGDDWTINQENLYIRAQRARQAAWDEYMACSEKERQAWGRMKAADYKAIDCTAPVRAEPEDPDRDDDAVPDSEDAEDHYQLDMSVSASGERSYGVENIQLDFAVPLGLGPRPGHDHFGSFNFGVINDAEFGGEVMLEGGERSYQLDPESGEIVFGDGEQGARLPSGDFETGDIPELTVEVSVPGVDAVLFVPLFNQAAELPLGVGVSTADGASWPEGWEEVGEPIVLALEPWSDYGGEPELEPVAPADVEIRLNLQPLTPLEDGQVIYGDLLFARFEWWLESNLRMTQTEGWNFEVDPAVVSPQVLPVNVQDSDSMPGEQPEAMGDSTMTRTVNWNLEELQTLTGRVLQNGEAVGEYEIGLGLDGTAQLTCDLSTLDRGERAELEDPKPGSWPMGTPTGPLGPFGGLDDWPQDSLLDQILRTMFVGLYSPWGFIPGAGASEVDCSAAVEELRRLREEAEECDCSEEDEALDRALENYFDAMAAATEADAAKKEADQAKEDADQAKEDADKAVEDAEQAEKDAQDELERYINEEVPGATAVSGTASEAGAHGYGAQHAGGFACGNNFVGARIGDNAAWNAHRPGINERMNAWRSAFRAAKKARKEAEAAAEAAEQAAEDAEQAQEDVDAANEDLAEAEAELDAALEAWEACMEACDARDRQIEEASAKVRECGLEPDEVGGNEEDGGEAPDSGSGGGTAAGGGDEDTGGDHDPGTATSGGDGGDADDAPDSGGGEGTAAGGGGTSGGGTGGRTGSGETTPGGTTAGPRGGGTGVLPGSGGDDDDEPDDDRPDGGYPWEDPPSGATGDEDLDELIKLFEKVAELIRQWEEVKDQFEDNDLVSEVRLYQSIGDLLSNIGELDSEISNALEEFAGCNSQPLEELLSAGGDKIDAVIAALGLLKGVIGIYMIVDSDMPASRKAKLNSIKDKLDKACEKLEELKDKGEDASELASTLAAIKEGEIWPDDIVEWLTDKLEGMLSDAASELADEIIEKAVEKVVGSKAAGPIISIIKDLCDTADAIGSKLDLDDLDEAITQALLDAISKADSMEQYSIPCEWEYLSGKYIWIAGSPEDWANTQVAFKWEKRCLCADGTWKTYTCSASAPTVEDKDGRRYWTFPKVDLPKSECKPCYLTVDVTIKRGRTQVTHTLLVGVQVCK